MEFINNVINDNVIMAYIVGINFALTIITLIICYVCINKYNRLNRRYEKFMSKLGQGDKIEEMLSEYIESVRVLGLKDADLKDAVDRLENNLKKCVQKVGLVRYNAYNDTGSDLSFTLAIMDAEDNGVVVNGLYSRESSSIFAKPLVKGETKYNLSAEEIQAIDIAKASSNARYI